MPNPIRILGIESSCDETAVAIVEDGRRILANRVASQIEQHAPYGGIVPEVASRHHMERLQPLVEQAMADAECTPADIDAVAVTVGPGLVGALLVGVAYAKALAYGWGKPLLALNHLEGHLYAPFLDGEVQPAFPHVALLVSGGHSCLYRVDAWGRYQRLGTTRDDAVGEAYDKVAKHLGLGYPGGPIIDRLAAETEREAFPLPRPMLADGGYDFSFSGLKTAVINALAECNKEGEEPAAGEVARAFQEAAVDVLVDKTLRAAEASSAKRVTLTGGVAANRRLRQRLQEACDQAGVTLCVPPFSLCTDNAAMIAGAAYPHFAAGDFADPRAGATARLPIANYG